MLKMKIAIGKKLSAPAQIFGKFDSLIFNFVDTYTYTHQINLDPLRKKLKNLYSIVTEMSIELIK